MPTKSTGTKSSAKRSKTSGLGRGISNLIPEKSEIRSIGIHNLEKNLKGNINAFSGNSGVGKSTLINAIFKDTICKCTGTQRKKNTDVSRSAISLK